MVVATSLALGLLLGLGAVQLLQWLWNTIFCGFRLFDQKEVFSQSALDRKQERNGVLNMVKEDDPSDIVAEEDDEEKDRFENIVDVDDDEPADEEKPSNKKISIDPIPDSPPSPTP